MEIVIWLRNALQALEPMHIYVLMASALLLVIALLGGAPLKIKEVRMGPLTKWDRWNCGITAVMVFALWAFIPRSVEATKAISVQGLVMMGAWSEVQPSDLNVTFEPTSSLKKSVIGPDGQFEFPATEGLVEGTYNISISRGDGRREEVTEYPVNLIKGAGVLVIMKEGKPPTIRVGDVQNELIDRYKSSPEWIDRVQIIERISAMAINSTPVKERMTKLLSSQEDSERELAAFTLGRLCGKAAREQLEKIKAEHLDWFLRIRASWNLSCDSSRKELENTYLLGVLTKSKSAVITNSKSPITKQHSWAAALFLARNLVKSKCVISVLEEGLEAEKEAIREISLIMLNRLTEKKFPDKTAWKLWWATGDHSFFETCPSAN